MTGLDGNAPMRFMKGRYPDVEAPGIEPGFTVFTGKGPMEKILESCRAELSFVECIYMVCQTIGMSQVVAGDEYRPPISFPQLANDILQDRRSRGIHVGHRLIKEQDVRINSQGPGYGHPFCLSSGQGLGRTMAKRIIQLNFPQALPYQGFSF